MTLGRPRIYPGRFVDHSMMIPARQQCNGTPDVANVAQAGGSCRLFPHLHGHWFYAGSNVVAPTRASMNAQACGYFSGEKHRFNNLIRSGYAAIQWAGETRKNKKKTSTICAKHVFVQRSKEQQCNSIHVCQYICNTDWEKKTASE